MLLGLSLLPSGWATSQSLGMATPKPVLIVMAPTRATSNICMQTEQEVGPAEDADFMRPQFSRRMALLSSCSMAALAVLTPAMPVSAEDIEPVLDGIVERAQRGQLSSAKVMERARQNALVDDGSANSLSCEILDQLVRVDQSACDASASSLKALQGRRKSDDPIEEAEARASLTELQTIKARIDKQIKRLLSLEEQKGCLDAVATYDRAKILDRAKYGTLSTDRVIQRARVKQLVPVEDPTLGCDALDALRKVDRKALQELEREVERGNDQSTALEDLKVQIIKADTRYESFCNSAMDLTAGTM